MFDESMSPGRPETRAARLDTVDSGWVGASPDDAPRHLLVAGSPSLPSDVSKGLHRIVIYERAGAQRASMTTVPANRS